MVKGINFLSLRDAGNPVELGSRYCIDGADELVFLDISASAEQRRTLSNMVRAVASELTIPFTVGGGIRTVEEARILLSAGAEKVSVNTAAVERPSLVRELSDAFGSQCVVVAIDAKQPITNLRCPSDDRYEVFIYGGAKDTKIDVVQWASTVESLGAGEILLTSMDRDGTSLGYDVNLTKAVSLKVNVPVIASGGAGAPNSFLEVLTEGAADAALAASSFHYDRYPIPVVKRYLFDNGVDVRL